MVVRGHWAWGSRLEASPVYQFKAQGSSEGSSVQGSRLNVIRGLAMRLEAYESSVQGLRLKVTHCLRIGWFKISGS